MTERTRASGPLPWGRVFDPEANARALGEVQERGLRAASELVDRLVAAVDGRRAAQAPPPPGDAGEAPRESASPGPAEALIELWTDLLHRGIDALTDLAQPRVPDEPIVVDLAGANMRSALSFVLATGTHDSAEIWLHNPSEVLLGSVRPTVGELRSSDGEVLPAASIRFAPEAFEVDSRSSRGVIVEVEIPQGTATGRFRGIVQVVGAPDVWLPIEVDVR